MPRRFMKTGYSQQRSAFWPVVGGCAAGAFVSWYLVNRARSSPASALSSQVYAKQPPAGPDSSPEKPSIQAAREMRFLRFASVEYQGGVYMTPQDFLESITEEVPRLLLQLTRWHGEQTVPHVAELVSPCINSWSVWDNLLIIPSGEQKNNYVVLEFSS
ncbi:hypothetical protein LSAT2_020708 [Lamellibrachia satsuma]|nr:hypothetical protein LSAT2_020708 [Lamellibrachia satsuma]